jgi:hypothetical protein
MSKPQVLKFDESFVENGAVRPTNGARKFIFDLFSPFDMHVTEMEQIKARARNTITSSDLEQFETNEAEYKELCTQLGKLSEKLEKDEEAALVEYNAKVALLRATDGNARHQLREGHARKTVANAEAHQTRCDMARARKADEKRESLHKLSKTLRTVNSHNRDGKYAHYKVSKVYDAMRGSGKRSANNCDDSNESVVGTPSPNKAHRMDDNSDDESQSDSTDNEDDLPVRCATKDKPHARVVDTDEDETLFADLRTKIKFSSC